MITPSLRLVLDQYLARQVNGEFPGYPLAACPVALDKDDPRSTYLDWTLHRIKVVAGQGGGEAAKILRDIQLELLGVNWRRAELALPLTDAQDREVFDGVVQLANAAIAHGYDQWVTCKPPLPYPAPNRLINPDDPVSGAVVTSSLTAFMKSMSAGGWDHANDKLWFARRERRGPQRAEETGIHPDLVGIPVPQSVVDYFFHTASLELASAARLDQLKTTSQDDLTYITNLPGHAPVTDWQPPVQNLTLSSIEPQRCFSLSNYRPPRVL